MKDTKSNQRLGLVIRALVLVVCLLVCVKMVTSCKSAGKGRNLDLMLSTIIILTSVGSMCKLLAPHLLEIHLQLSMLSNQ